jgi:dTDP-4-dehydrorhamnose reductase
VRILVTGAGGQLGRALTAALHEHTVEAHPHGALDVGRLDDVRAALRSRDAEIVINAAGFTDVDGAETDPDGAFRANALGPENLARATAEREIPLVHVSSDYVFAGDGARPLLEHDPPGPLSVYGRSKLAGEEAVRHLQPRHFVVRTAWLYDVMGRNFPNTLIALADRPELRVVDDQHGSPTFAPHLARAITHLVGTARFGTWHLAGRGGTTWFGFARALFSAAGLPTPIVPVATAEFPRPAARPAYAVLGTAQDPPILLPPWEEGVAAWAAARRQAQDARSSASNPSR